MVNSEAASIVRKQIWGKPMDDARLAAMPEALDRLCARSVHQALGIRFRRVGADFIEASLAITDAVRQPMGLLHGGVSVVLAESLGSIASYLVVEGSGAECFGIEVSASHVKSARDGEIVGCVRPLNLGQRIHLWQIEIRDAAEELLCSARLTVYVRGARRDGPPSV